MLIMAIEAVRQLLPVGATISGYRLKDVSMLSAISLSSTQQGTETQLTLRPSKGSATPFSKWSDFRICVRDPNTWRECCRGFISVEYGDSTWSPSGINEREEEHARENLVLDQVHATCEISLDKTKVYQALENIGLGYGPTFQGLNDVRVDDKGNAWAAIDLHHWKSADPNAKCKPHVIHPTALDSVFQLVIPARTGSSLERIPTMVPTFLGSLWISSDISKTSDSTRVDACVKSKKSGLREIHASWKARDPSSGKMLAAIDASMTYVDSIRSNDLTDHDLSRRLYTIDWRPDVTLLADAKQLGVYATPDSTSEVDVQEKYIDKEWLCLSAIQTALKDLSPSHVAPTPHLECYVSWMRRQLEILEGRVERYDTARSRSEADPDHFRLSVGDFDLEANILANIAPKLSGILHGTVDPLELLFTGDMLKRFYREGQWTLGMQDQIKALIGAMAHKTPGLKLLEVGAGTGGLTSVILDELTGDARRRSAAALFEQYVYTDISPSFFMQAKERFPDPRLVFRTLDISSDLNAQGFETGTFDVVLASHVLHATSDIEQTLRNCRSLLKPGGKILIHENMDPERLETGFIFGLLPGVRNVYVRTAFETTTDFVYVLLVVAQPGKQSQVEPSFVADGVDQASYEHGILGG
jgi:ubiquinone/menaquinone biosynthesis C-methylase UbiE